jgi:benzodiazapine receptor
MKKRNKKIVKFIAAILVCQLAGIVGSVFTTPNIGAWYATINKPSFTPPNWVFAPVWTTLFFLMGVSLYLALEKKEMMGIYAFGVQLFLNILWSVLFFGVQNPFLAFVEIFALWISIAATMFLFYRSSKTAAYLLVPYIVWVSFAAFLNYSVWILNV